MIFFLLLALSSILPRTPLLDLYNQAVQLNESNRFEDAALLIARIGELTIML